MAEKPPSERATGIAIVGIIALMVMTGVILLSLVTLTEPHPPLRTPLFAIAPFLGASLAAGAAGWWCLQTGLPGGRVLAILFALSGLVSFGPQKYLVANIGEIWPTVLGAQLAIIAIVAGSVLSWRR